MSPKRRHDPDRRIRIIGTTLDVIAEFGVAGTTHRRIAAAADVPLGSMTYHFSGVDQVIAEAFKHLAEEISERYSAALERAGDVDEAREAVVQLIAGGLLADDRDMALQLELYAYVARHPGARHLVSNWMERSRHALEIHFDSMTARALDAFLEGVTIHNFFKPGEVSVEDIRLMVLRLTG